MKDYKIPPQNIEAEKSVLGSILIDEDVIFKVGDRLKPEYFYDPRHRIIFEAMLYLYVNRKAIDVLTLSTRLKADKKLKQAGGMAYLSEIVEAVPTSAHVEEYAKIILEQSKRRGLLSLSGELADLAYKEDKELSLIFDDIEQKLMSITQNEDKSSFVKVATLLEESIKRAEELNKNPDKLSGIKTGFKFLDTKLGGLHNSDLIILAARPSVGKTAFVLDIARHIAVNENKSVGIFSLEMSNMQLMDRIVSMQANMNLWDYKTGNIPDEVFERLSEVMGQLYSAPLYIDDTPGLNILEMRAKARRLKIEKSLDVVIVDYLQLMSGLTRENRVQEVSEISRFLKLLARELDIPVIALSQLSRAVEQRGGGTPQLSDLRESGSIEQDADIVLFLSKMSGDDDSGENENRKLIISKHRNGPTGETELFFVKEQARFREIDNRF